VDCSSPSASSAPSKRVEHGEPDRASPERVPRNDPVGVPLICLSFPARSRRSRRQRGSADIPARRRLSEISTGTMPLVRASLSAMWPEWGVFYRRRLTGSPRAIRRPRARPRTNRQTGKLLIDDWLGGGVLGPFKFEIFSDLGSAKQQSLGGTKERRYLITAWYPVPLGELNLSSP
jgi:hypothetical protein